MWAHPGHRRPTNRTVRAPRATGRIVVLLRGLVLLRSAALVLLLGLISSLTFAADASPAATRRITHRPDVPKPPLDASSEYRAAIAESAVRYLKLYEAADFSSALAEARHGLVLATRAQRPRDEAEFLKPLAYVNWLMGESAAALDYGQKLLVRAAEFSDDRLLSFAHRIVGTAHRQLGDLAKFRSHTELALAAAERSGDDTLRYAALNNLGNVALAAGDLPTARRLHTQVLLYREKNGHQWDAAGSLTNLADVSEAEGDLPAALALQERALALRTEYQDARGQVRSLRQVAGLLRRLGRLDEALVHLVDARARAEKIGGHELLDFVYAELTRLREARGEYAEALATERLAAREREALAGDRTRARAADLEARYDLASMQKTIAALAREKHLQAAELAAASADLARTRSTRLALAAVAIAAATLLGAIVLVQRTRIRAERRILADTRAARDAAEQADALKSRLLGFASHDLKAPLAALSGATHLLEESAAQPDQVRSLAGTMRAEAFRMIHLVHDFIDRSALDAGRLELRPAPLDLAHTVARVVADFRPRAAQKFQSLAFDRPVASLPLVAGEAARLEQVVANLLSNAVNYTPLHGHIQVTLGHDASGVWCVVRDSGPGIPPAEQARLFQPFARLSARPTAGESSSGLGLYLAHELVRLHAGQLTVDSQSGAGASFRLTLPVLPPPAPAC